MRSRPGRVRPLRIHVLYERGSDPRPYSPSYIRLLRPLTHPSVAPLASVTWSERFPGREPGSDVVIVDRFWRPGLTADDAERLIADAHAAGAKLILAIDDDLTQTHRPGTEVRDHAAEALEVFLRGADGLFVSSDRLAERLAPYGPKLAVVGNALDERLIVDGAGPLPAQPFGPPAALTIGYMGTRTHDDDLLLIAPALREVARRRPGAFTLEIVGAVERESTLAALEDVPWKWLEPARGESEYPLFMLWLGGRAAWDIALAPLRDTPFNACKSDIKFLDYAALGAAGIYSDVPAYRETVRHRETGWLAGASVEDWIDALESMLDDPDLRRGMAAKAHAYLMAERILARRATEWPRALAELTV